MKRFFWLFIVGCMAFFVLTGLQPLQAQTVKILPDVDTIYACPDSTLTLIASGGVDYQWTTTGAAFPDPRRDTVTLRGSAGSFVLVTLSGVTRGQRQRDTVLIIFTQPSLIVQALDPSTVCRGTGVRLRAITNTDGFGLTWQPADGLSAITGEIVTARPATTTTYTAILNITGCEVRRNITVTIQPPRVDIAQGDTVELCLGARLQLSATTNTGNAQGLSWSASDGSFRDTLKLGVEVSPRVTTTYYARFANGGCIITDSILVKVDSLPPDLRITAEPKKDPYCQGELVTLTSPVFEPFLYPGIKHRWFPDKGFETPDSLYNMVITTQDSTIYFRETKIGGCIDTFGLLVPVIKPKDITIVPVDPVICPGESVQLTASFEGEGEIKWTPEQNISCLECKNPRVNPPNSTSYTITVTEKGCPSSQSVNVTVLSLPLTPVAINPTICRGDSITLFLANPEPDVIYRWVSPQIPSLDASIARLRVAPTANTTYTLTAQRGQCPAVSVSTTINVIQPADVNVPPAQRICPGQPLTLTATGTAPAGVQQSFIWTWNNGLNTSTGPTVTVNNLQQSTVFNVIYTYGPNCGVITKSVTVTVDAVPVINGFTFDPSDAPAVGIALGDVLRVNVLTTPPNPANVTFSWQANGQAIAGATNSIQHQPDVDPTVYTVVIRTANGCEVTASTTPIRVRQPEFDIPNAFTPDGDGNNDFFNVVFTGAVTISEFRVWNRWGQLVYNNANPANGWDGRHNGKPAPSDVYVYRIVLRFPDGQEFVRKGDVTLLR